ncbi:hypothetical protein QAD02_021242 [Eretmocerus hayati]|uniref:Uncharacterized protein n=1 Tax=Eretmocerus hayati TaxID=131215 RepID=A0ACC2PPC8_9HYME|nr:hypothetical protein QAD02_021242 [Eretmocerus hayati]
MNQRRELNAESEGPNRVRKLFCNAMDTQETGRKHLSAVNERSTEESRFIRHINGSPAKKFKLSDCGERNNGRNDDVHIQETSDAVEHIETVGRRNENIDGIELVGGVGNIRQFERIVENIGPVERIAENIGPVERIAGNITPVRRIAEIIGPVEGIVENIGPVGRIVENIGPVGRIIENIGPVEGISEDIGPVKRILENIVGEIESIRPVGKNVEDIGHIVDEIEVEPVNHVERPESYTNGKPHTPLLTEEESGEPHTSLLTEEESGTFRDIDNIDYKLGQLEISPPGTAAWDIFPIKINDQFKRRNVEIIHTRRKETSQTGNKSSLRDLGYNWKAVDLLSKSEVDVFNPIKRKRSDSPGGWPWSKEDVRMYGGKDAIIRIHRIAAALVQEPEANEPEGKINEPHNIGEPNDEIVLAIDDYEADEIPANGNPNPTEGPAGEAQNTPGISFREAVEQLRRLGPSSFGHLVDKGYHSGEDEEPGRESLEDRIRAMAEIIADRPLVNLGIEMMEHLGRGQQERGQREEPVLIENNHINNQPPFVVESDLGEIGNPLPRRLDALGRAPAPGLYEAIEPFRIQFMP